jgi:hypothetical protein
MSTSLNFHMEFAEDGSTIYDKKKLKDGTLSTQSI